jgi:hypothetical protein
MGGQLLTSEPARPLLHCGVGGFSVLLDRLVAVCHELHQVLRFKEGHAHSNPY